MCFSRLKPRRDGALSARRLAALGLALGVLLSVGCRGARKLDLTAAAAGTPVLLPTEAPKPPPPLPPGGEVSAEPYRLGIGDALEVSIYGLDNSRRRVPIDPSGSITYMGVGTVRAAGRTVDELREELQRLLAQTYRYYLINVVPVTFGSLSYTVLGQVTNPGMYPMHGRTTIVEALCRAGGLSSGQYRASTVDLADMQHAVLIRGGATVPVDFEALILKGDTAWNADLASGDIIHIPSVLKKSVYVLGEVQFPRSIGFYGSVTLMGALAEAGGTLAGAGRTAYLIRGKLAEPRLGQVDLEDLLRGKAADVPLAPDDIIYIPARRFEFARGVVEAAMRSFALTVAGDSGSALYRQQIRGGTGTTKPTVLP
jgi:polysaccharide export outer membrane protein